MNSLLRPLRRQRGLSFREGRRGRDLQLCESLQYVWVPKVSNAGTPSASNPVAFLASITAGFAIDYPLSSSNWEISTDTPGTTPPDFSLLTWVAATQIVQNGTSGSIWWNNNSNGPVTGIPDAAYWIWTDDHNTSDAPSTAFIRTTINVADGGATLLLMGICLTFIAGLKNRQ